MWNMFKVNNKDVNNIVQVSLLLNFIDHAEIYFHAALNSCESIVFGQTSEIWINPSRRDLGRREKINLIFIFTLLCGASKGFIKVLKAFIKPFEAPQRSAKIKI